MNEPLIVCPNCKSEIKLTESLAAPLIESTRREYEQKFTQKEADVAKREGAVKEQQAALAKAQENINEQVAAKLKSERTVIVTQEAKKAREAIADELGKAQLEKAEVHELLKQRDAKLAEAQKNEIDLRRERQSLLEEKENFELVKQRAIDAERGKIREALRLVVRRPANSFIRSHHPCVMSVGP